MRSRLHRASQSRLDVPEDAIREFLDGLAAMIAESMLTEDREGEDDAQTDHVISPGGVKHASHSLRPV